jgi:hypothetical protein
MLRALSVVARDTRPVRCAVVAVRRLKAPQQEPRYIAQPAMVRAILCASIATAWVQRCVPNATEPVLVELRAGVTPVKKRTHE